MLAVEVKHRRLVRIDDLRSRLQANLHFPWLLFVTTQHTVTNRSYRYNGTCYDAWPSGNTLSQFVTIYR